VPREHLRLFRGELDHSTSAIGFAVNFLGGDHAWKREVLSGDFFPQESLSSGSRAGWDSRFRRIRKRVFMDLTASWTGDLGVQFHLFFVLVGHPF
jgi:hypothetical protein